MEFTYEGYFYLEPTDFEKMVKLCRTDKMTPKEAFNKVASRMDDCDYYCIDYVEDQIIAKIEEELNKPIKHYDED